MSFFELGADEGANEAPIPQPLSRNIAFNIGTSREMKYKKSSYQASQSKKESIEYDAI